MQTKRMIAFLLSSMAIGCASTPTYVVDTRTFPFTCFTELGWDTTLIPCEKIFSDPERMDFTFDDDQGIAPIVQERLKGSTDVIDQIGRRTVVWKWLRGTNYWYTFKAKQAQWADTTGVVSKNSIVSQVVF